MGSAEHSEVFRLALVVIMLPVYLMFLRRLRPTPGRLPFAAAVGVIFLSYVVSLFDPKGPGSLADATQHLLYAVAGVLSLVSMLIARRAGLRERERS